jgi:hypothetical protein
MGSGPVVISDDGSPPPGLLGSGMRVGRLYEFMQQLEIATGCHTVLGGVKAISAVYVNDVKKPLSGGGKDTVVVTGDGGTVVTVASDGTAVTVCTNANALQEDLYKHWGRYKASDTSITAVSLNGSSVLSGNPPKVRVRVELA